LAFGRLQGIDLLGGLFFIVLYMGGQVAGPPAPLDGRVRKRRAERVAVGTQNPVAASTFRHHRFAAAAVERTAFFGHKGTINPWFQAYAVHGRSPP